MTPTQAGLLVLLGAVVAAGVVVALDAGCADEPVSADVQHAEPTPEWDSAHSPGERQATSLGGEGVLDPRPSERSRAELEAWFDDLAEPAPDGGGRL